MVDDRETGVDTSQPYQKRIALLKDLDPETWDSLLRYYADDLRRDILGSLRKRGLPEELADDIEQETWLTAVRKIKDFVWESDEKFYHWLRAISLNHLRTYRRMQHSSVSIDDFGNGDSEADLERFFESHELSEGGVEDSVILHEQLAALDKAMRQLKPQEREILMRWLMGETPKQLALTYKIKPRSISMVLLRAKDKIEANLLHLN